MATSYVHEALAAKHGGAANLYGAEARHNLASGVAALGLVVLVCVMTYLSTGSGVIATIPTVGAIIWLLRARRFHRQSRAAREAERGSKDR